MSAKPTKGIHRDVTTGEAIVMGPRGEEIRFTKDAIRSGVAVSQDAPAAGAISSKQGLVVLSTASGARTLADPTAGTDDGKRLDIIATAAAAGATVAPGTTFGDGANDTATFAAGAGLSLVAYGGLWYVLAGTAVISGAP